MKIYQKIRCLRELKQLSQDELAGKIDMSTNGYSKIEQGKTRASMSRLEQIAEKLEIDLMELLTFGEMGVCCFIGENNHNGQIAGSSITLAAEIQKLQMTVEHQQEMLAQKDKVITYLQQMLELCKPQSNKPSFSANSS
jgi:transcriptional regulator with XRE-family HTH domain